jgi:hypothetical protein
MTPQEALARALNHEYPLDNDWGKYGAEWTEEDTAMVLRSLPDGSAVVTVESLGDALHRKGILYRIGGMDYCHHRGSDEGHAEKHRHEAEGVIAAHRSEGIETMLDFGVAAVDAAGNIKPASGGVKG